MAYEVDFDTLHGVAAGKHFYQFYKNREDYVRVIVSFFQAGIESGDACLWLASERMDIDYLKTFASLVVPKFGAFEKSEQFRILPAEGWYLTGRDFDPEKSIRQADCYLKESIRRGFQRLRIVGDAGAFLTPEASDHVDRYEKTVDCFIQELPVICVCAYPIHECSMRQTKNVIDSHSGGVFFGRID